MSETSRQQLEKRALSLGFSSLDVEFATENRLQRYIQDSADKKPKSERQLSIGSNRSSTSASAKTSELVLNKGQFPNVDNVGEFETYFCNQFLVAEQSYLKQKQIRELLSVKNKIYDEIVQVAQLLNHYISPLAKLNCFDEEDRKYLGIHAHAVLGASSHQKPTTSSDINNNNPIWQMYELQSGIVVKLQTIVTNREKAIQDSSIRLEPHQVEYFTKKNQILNQLLKIQDKKLAFLDYVMTKNRIQNMMFIDASRLLEEKKVNVQQFLDDE